MRHCSRRTDDAYVTWIRRFIVFNDKRHPSALGAPEISRYLSWLATDRRVSVSTQNQALSAVLFLYRSVLGVEPGGIEGVVRASARVRLPVVLTRHEVAAVLGRLDGVVMLVCTLLYGAGLRVREALELRVKDIDFERREVVVRQGKWRKDRMTMLPSSLGTKLASHLEVVRAQHGADLARGFGRVVLPDALDRKYPHAAFEWPWQFVFPAARLCIDPQFGPPTRFHPHESAVQRRVTHAVRSAGIHKRATCHTFRNVSALVCDPPTGGQI